jgi:hypothetical protein
VSAPSLDSVTIRNATDLAITVTVRLNVSQIQKPFINYTIPAKGNTTVLFDFGTATNAFMTADIRRADGGQSPSPFIGANLVQPDGGYDGELFTVSILGSYFDIRSG